MLLLSRLALRALAPAGLKSLAPSLPVGMVQEARSFHKCQHRLALPPLQDQGKMRLVVVPEEFFQFLYPKTGVTGPYMFGTGVILFLISKELYIFNSETNASIASLGLITIVVKKYGSAVKAFADKTIEAPFVAGEIVRLGTIRCCEERIQEEKKEQWRAEGYSYIFDAKRNNVAMLLEINYRERLLNVYNEVKRRLDYQLELKHLKQRMEQGHMINWIEQNVKQSITPQQEKESITKCILDLKMLLKSTRATV